MMTPSSSNPTERANPCTTTPTKWEAFHARDACRTHHEPMGERRSELRRDDCRHEELQCPAVGSSRQPQKQAQNQLDCEEFVTCDIVTCDIKASN